jgi:hypothetical protein
MQTRRILNVLKKGLMKPVMILCNIFLSDADWDFSPINDQIAINADKFLGGQKETALFILTKLVSQKRERCLLEFPGRGGANLVKPTIVR